MASGAGLIFQTLPVAFAQMPGGHIFATLFFIMLAVAGITSMVGLLESVTAWVGERFALHRHVGSALVVAAVTLCSVASVLSYGIWSGYTVAGFNFNDVAFAIPDKVLLPAGGLLIATFAGWFMLKVHSTNELNTTPAIYGLWRQLVRYVAVPAIAFILISGLI
jgi:NSS family neurotransmitter:Na+ symporter